MAKFRLGFDHGYDNYIVVDEMDGIEIISLCYIPSGTAEGI